MKTAKLLVCGALAAASAFAAKPVQVITNATLPCNATTTWTKNNVYHLSGRVFVGQSAACPQELHIQAGTTVKGMLGELAAASVLVITKFGKIKANGTASEPIVFTTVLDNEEDPTDLGPYDRYQWGGVIILGNAPISENTTTFIEGINNDVRGSYGGTNVADSSGEFTYVSIRHGGKIIGNDNEINGLTMGGVGNKTVIHHVEVFANGDDGFEWFGGTVNAKYLISAYGNDDAFDFDLGYRGKLQYAFAAYHKGNADANGNQAIEGDGFIFPVVPAVTDTALYSRPDWSNLTLIGNGSTVPTGFTFANDVAFRLRDGTGGNFNNMVLGNWPQNAQRFDLQGAICDAMCKQNQNILNVDDNVFYNFGNYGNSLSNLVVNGVGADSLVFNNVYADPQLASMPNGSSWLQNSVDPRPSPTGVAVTTNHTQMGNPFFDNVTYAGAFSPTEASWMDGWTAISQMGIAKKYMTFQPAGGSQIKPGKLYLPASWDFVMTQSSLDNAPALPLNVAASQAWLDGNDVSSIFQSSIFPFATVASNGDRVYTAPGQSGFTFGTAGTHSLRVKLVLTNGQVIDETTHWVTAQ